MALVTLRDRPAAMTEATAEDLAASPITQR
jgi:hypothetical protein